MWLGFVSFRSAHACASCKKTAPALLCVLCAFLLHWTPSRAAESRSTGATLTNRPVWRFDITLQPAQEASLRQDSRTDVRARVEIDGETFDQVALHLKGRVGSFRPLDDKPSLTLDFQQSVLAQRWASLRKVHLNNSVQDPAFIKDCIGSSLFRAAGIPVPYLSHAIVRLNGRDLGLYVLKEGFAREFFARSVGRTTGLLYEPGVDRNGAPAMEVKKLGEFDEGTDPLLSLLKAAREPDLLLRWTRMNELLDVDKFIQFLAMEVLIGHWDGYAMGQNNFRIFFNPASRRLLFLPSGMDQIFSNPQLPWNPRMSSEAAAALIETREGQRRYENAIRSLFANAFHASELTQEVMRLIVPLRPFLRGAQRAELEQEARTFCERITARQSALRTQFARRLSLLQVPPAGTALENWSPEPGLPPEAAFEAAAAGETNLCLVASGPMSASWRTALRLPAGKYRLEGRARVAGVEPLAFGKTQGAGFRVSGMLSDGPRLTRTSDWSVLAMDFQIEAEQEIELICELRAARGQAWFARDSLRIRKVQ